MTSKKHSFAVFFIFLAGLFYGQSFGVNGSGLKVMFGPAMSFYSINTNHAQNPSPRVSGMAGIRKEVRCDPQYRLFFLFGADYFFHGINFRSYFFTQDTLQIYDKSFAYDYSVSFHEINIPLQMKYSFTRENNSLFSPYAIIGYHLRIFTPARVRVSQEGNIISDHHEEMRFKNGLIDKHMNAFMSAGIGWQKNTINKSRTGFMVELSARYGFSPYYFKAKYSPSSLYINGFHLNMMLGLKF